MQRGFRPSLSAALLTALFWIVACGGEDTPTPVAESAPGQPIAGMYQVTGVTVEVQGGQKREISGTVILAVDGSNYTSTFDLDTAFQTPEGVLSADVIGNGSGTVEGRILEGDAHTQVIISTVPGIDPGFAFVPRTTTTRIVSKSLTTIANDGSVEIEIKSSGDEGDTYAPTRTVLRGARVSTDATSAIGGDLEDPHSSPMGEAGP
jgi:hypothetical protein